MKALGCLAVVLMMVLPGCNQAKVGCDTPEAKDVIVSVVKTQIERSAQLQGNGTNGPSAPLSKIRAMLAQMTISLGDIRTTKEDPNSTKRFCEATLKIRFPADTLNDADQARSDAGTSSVSDLAEKSEIERQADSFSGSIEFNVQPTDDRSKIYGETESGNGIFAFAGEVIASGLLRSTLEDARRQAQIAQDQQTAAQNAALQEQRNANLETAKTENQLATQTINAVWRSLPPTARGQLLDLQRAWVRKKDADCHVEAASASIEPSEMEVARMICDTRMTQERITELRQIPALPTGGSDTSLDGEPVQPGT